MKLIKNIIKRIIFINKNYGKNVIINKNVHLSFKTMFEGKNKIGANCNISGSYIGLGSYIGNNSIITETQIGRYCSIANDVHVIHGFHPTEKFLSTHPAFYSITKQAGFTFTKEQLFEERRMSPSVDGYSLDIGHDVWIGSNVKILEGISIANGTIIAAGSVVTKNTTEYGIYGGVPAKLIRKRFSDDEIEYLQNMKWWYWDEETLRHSVNHFSDIKNFVNEEIL